MYYRHTELSWAIAPLVAALVGACGEKDTILGSLPPNTGSGGASAAGAAGSGGLGTDGGATSPTEATGGASGRAGAAGGAGTLPAGHAGAAGAGDGGSRAPADAGGNQGDGGACGCFSGGPLSWGSDGGMVAFALKTTLSCQGFDRRTTAYEPSGAGPYTCHVDLDCVEWGPDLQAIDQALALPEVQSALAKGTVLFGSDPRPVDGTVFRISFGKGIIDIGDACAGDAAACVNPPAGVVALHDAVRKLEQRAAMTCSPECLPQPRVMKPICSQGGGYVWSGTTCVPLRSGTDPHGVGCGDISTTSQECTTRHLQCLGLYTQVCGGDLPGGCDADQYCAYLAGDANSDACGAADAGAVCLPRPRSCPSSMSPVCGCDTKTYSNDCEAARAGTGISRAAGCDAAACSTDGECAGMRQACYEQGGSGVIALQPFCLNGACQCACGFRNDAGVFEAQMCR